MIKPLYRIIIISSIISIILSNFGSINSSKVALAQINEKTEKEAPKIPETPEEIKDFILRLIRPLPEAIKGAWQEAVAIWQKMFDFFRNLWDSYIFPKIEMIWQKILSLFGREIEKRKEILPQELEKEKKELFK